MTAYRQREESIAVKQDGKATQEIRRGVGSQLYLVDLIERKFKERLTSETDTRNAIVDFLTPIRATEVVRRQLAEICATDSHLIEHSVKKKPLNTQVHIAPGTGCEIKTSGLQHGV